MASDIKLLNHQFLSLFMKIGFMFLLFMIIAFWISLKISKNVQIETNKILTYLKNLTNKSNNIKIESTYSIEFNKITNLLNKVSENIIKRNKQKNKYTAKLKLSNRQKDDIISAISHEFKNPIAVISGYTQALLEEKDLNHKIRDKFLTKISSSSLKLTNMIDRLRLSIKLEEGKQVSHFTKSNISLLIGDIIDDLQVTYPKREVDFVHQNVQINIDLTLMSLAITNLIENALKYSQDAINIELKEHYLKITDQGIGISHEDISKITNKFYRVSSNSWNNSLGVGLFLVKNIIELHNFTLEIQSEENKGSSFIIHFK